MTAQPSPPLPRPAGAPPGADTGGTRPAQTRPTRAAALADRLGRPPRDVLLLGLAGTVLMLLAAPGGGGIPMRDPLLGNSWLSFLRYGHGQLLASGVVLAGLALLVWAWVRLGREVLARRLGGRAVLTLSAVWVLPVLVTPPLFTRDPYSYLAQGALPLAGFDPYVAGPDAMGGIFTDNVHFFWQDTPAPYGPLFILLAQGIVLLAGQNVLLGVILMRLSLVTGVLLLVAVLPALTRRLGGRPAVALWIAVANPVMIVHMVGGVHNDLLVVGLLPLAALLALRGRPATAVAVASLAMAVKASAGLILPFLVLVWAARLTGGFVSRLVRAGVPALLVYLVVFGGCTWVSGFGLGWLPALSAPSMIVNWLSWPTGAGQLIGAVAGMFADDLNEQAFVEVARAIGGGLLAVLIAVLWWWSREGGTVAVRNAAIAMAFAAVLSPTTLPWYLSWGFCLLAMTAWSTRGLQWVIAGSVWLMIVYFPNGETALYAWPFLALCAAAAGLAATSLLRPDPLGLRAPAPVPEHDGGPHAAERGVRAELDAAGVTDPALREAYAACRALHAEHGRTYFLATRLLPLQRRVDIHALYGFARHADEIVDDPDGAGGGVPERRLDELGRELDTALDDALGTGTPTAAAGLRPEVRAVAETARRHDLDPQLFRDFMVSMRMDLTVTDYATDAALGVYVHGSAAVIGLQTLPVLGTVTPRAEAEPYAALLGIAFQMTNFLRDVGEDLDRGRVYLPADELAAFGVDRELLAWCRSTGRTDPRVRRALAHLVARTRATYRRADPGIGMLEPVSRACVGTARTLYSGILDEIADAGYHVLGRRVAVPRGRRAAVAVPGLGRALALRGAQVARDRLRTPSPARGA